MCFFYVARLLSLLFALIGITHVHGALALLKAVEEKRCKYSLKDEVEQLKSTIHVLRETRKRLVYEKAHPCERKINAVTQQLVESDAQVQKRIDAIDTEIKSIQDHIAELVRS